jgi:hypothetical protein
MDRPTACNLATEHRPLRSLSGWLDWVPVVVMCGAALVIVLRTMWVSYQHLLPSPIADMYAFWLPLHEHGFQVADLLKPHNEHIILVPRLFYLADVKLAAGTGVLLQVGSWLLALGVPLVFAWAARRYFFTDRRNAWMYLGLVTLCYFHGEHLGSFVWGFMIQHWLESLSVVLLSLCFARLASDEGAAGLRLYAASLVLALVAIFSMGSGVVCLLATVAAGIALRLRWRPVLYFALLTAGCILLYHKLNPSQFGRSFSVLWNEPLAATKFFLATLGGPFLRCVTWPAPVLFWRAHPNRAVALGAALLVAAVVLLAREAFRRRRPGTFAVFHAVLILYVLGSALVLVLSRLSVDPFYGTEPKYAATMLLGWIAVFSLGLKNAAERVTLPTRYQPAAWLACLAGLMLLVMPAQRREERIVGDWYASLWESEAGQVAGVYDPFTLSAFEWQRPQAFALAQQYLKPRRLSVFHRYPFTMGDRLADHFAVAPANQCTGAVEKFQAVYGGPTAGYSVEGWACDADGRRPVRDIVLCTPGGQIMGIAHCCRKRLDLLAQRPTLDLRCGWFGYLRPCAPGTTITAYALVNGGRTACPIGTAPVP